jgi:hypothetical protein
MTAAGPAARASGELFDIASHPIVEWARRGWRVLALWGVRGRSCECGDPLCGSQGKHPRRGGVHNASADARIVMQWAREAPLGNWAIAMGNGVIAIDVDPRHGGDASIAAWQLENGELPPTLTNITGGGGYHLLFAWPTNGSELKNGEWLPGVDVKTLGGYIVWPPSRHVSGGQYALRDPVAVAVDAPESLAGALPRKGEVSPRSISVRERGGRIAKGGRNSFLTAAAGSLRRYGAEEGTILVALRDINANLCGLEEPELQSIAASVTRYDPELPDPEYARFARDLESKMREDNDRAQPGGRFILDEPDHIASVIGHGDDVLWAAGEAFMINGQQGTGKTLLGEQIVLHLVGVRTGGFLGLPVVTSDRPVLYLAMDRPRQAARLFRRMVSENHRGVLDDRLVVWRGPLPGSPLLSASWFADFAERICPGVGFVVVDSVKDLAPGISKDEVGAALNSSWQELIARGVELLLLHHERKASNGNQRLHSLDDVYGSTWLTAGLGSVVVLDGEPGDPTVELRHLKQPANPVGPLILRHDHATGATSVHTGELDLDQLLWTAGDEGTTAQDVALALFGRASESDLVKARRALHRLVAKGRAVKQAGSHSRAGRTADRYAMSPEHRWAAEQ